MKKFINIIKTKWLVKTTTTVLLIATLIVAYMALNMWIDTLNINDIDITKEKLYTLSDTSKEQVKNVEDDVTIYFFGFTEDSTQYDLAKQYENVNSKIKCEIVTDLTTRPDLVEYYGIEEGNTAVVVQAKDRNKILTTDEFYSYNYTTGEEKDLTEQKLTNEIIGTTIAEIPEIYFLTGHKEIYSYMSVFTAYLENEVNNINTLDLLVKGAVPENCDTLIIAAPSSDFSEYEAGLIKDYINKGGKILWFAEPLLNGESFPNMQSVLDMFGTSIGNGVVVEQDVNKMLIGSPYMILPDVAYTDITENIGTDGGVCFIDSGKLNFIADEQLESLGLDIEPVLTTSEESFFRTNFNTNSISATSQDEVGSSTVGAIVNKTINENTKATLVIYANGIFATEYPIQITDSQYLYPIERNNNKDLALNSVAYLNERDDAITIRKTTSTVTISPTQMEDLIVKIIIFVIPIIIIILGIVVWQVRRRKK